jgi:hypothetical protein
MLMNIVGIAGLELSEINDNVQSGWRFLQFEETRSFIVVSRRSFSPHYFVRPNEPTMTYAKKHILMTAILGWWGIPWGLIGTPISIMRNLRGGNDTTSEVLSALKLAASQRTSRQAETKKPLLAVRRAKTPQYGIPDADEAFWATAYAEIESNQRKMGVWAKAFAETHGDEVATKVLYLERRVYELRNAPPELIANLRRHGYHITYENERWTVADPRGCYTTFHSDLEELERHTPFLLTRQMS